MWLHLRPVSIEKTLDRRCNGATLASMVATAKSSKPSPEESEKQRRKADEVRKDTNLRMRVSEAHLKVFKAASERAGISLSAWVTDRLLRAARQEQKE